MLLLRQVWVLLMGHCHRRCGFHGSLLVLLLGDLFLDHMKLHYFLGVRSRL